MVLKDNNILYNIFYIPCFYRAPNSTTGNNDPLNQTIEDVSSRPKSELLVLGIPNCPNISNKWEKLYVTRTPEHYASKFYGYSKLVFTSSCFYRNTFSTKSKIRLKIYIK